MKSVIEAFLRGELEPPPVARFLGMRLVSGGEGEATMELDARPEFANPMGTVQGGIICALVDAAMGFAFASTVEDGESFTTLELKTNYLRPFWDGTLSARGWVVSRGRSVGLTECEVKDAEGRLVAHSTSTCMILRGEQAKGR